jgi:hypothetical protein
MPTTFVSGAAWLAIAAGAIAAPAFAQPEAPVPGQAQAPTNAPAPGAPPGPAAEGLTQAPGGVAQFAVVIVNVNLRNGPGTDAPILATIPAGSRVQVTDCSEWCTVTWNGQKGFAIARNLDIGGTRQARARRPQPGYAGPPPGVYEAGPPVVYGPPVYYGPPAVVYGPGYYGGYGPRYYGWRRRW